MGRQILLTLLIFISFSGSLEAQVFQLPFSSAREGGLAVETRVSNEVYDLNNVWVVEPDRNFNWVIHPAESFIDSIVIFLSSTFRSSKKQTLSEPKWMIEFKAARLLAVST